jgi:predicted DNA-binding antitoxin AbrB/MazE fold protein
MHLDGACLIAFARVGGRTTKVAVGKQQRLSLRPEAAKMAAPMSVIHAIFEDGVFKPTEPVNLPEHSAVEVHVPESAQRPAADEWFRANQRLTEILSRSYETGRTDTAARHDEHQP